MGIVSVVVSILGMKPVQTFLTGLMGKIGGPKAAINPKVVAAGGVGIWVAIIISVVKMLDPGLGALLEANQAALMSIAAVIASIVAYYTPNNTASP